MYKTIVTVVLLMAAALAYEPPSWMNLGDLSGAIHARDLYEITGTGYLLAAGQFDNVFDQAAVWRSTDMGVSWSRVFKSDRGASSLFWQMRGDAYNRAWVVGSDGGAEALAYSANNGSTWTWVSGPPSSPAISGRSITTIGDYLYHGGEVATPYSTSLHRLNVVNMQWELVVQYPQCNAITRLKYYNGRLLVFCRDMTTSAVRVFSYTPSDLDARAVPVGLAETRPADPVQD